MPSLRLLTLVATVAFSALTSVSALPVPASNVAVARGPAIELIGRQVPPATDPSAPQPSDLPPTPSPAPSGAPVTPAPGNPESLVSIIDELTVAITPSIEKLGEITKETAIVEIVAPLVNIINAALNVAINKVNALLAQPVEVVLATVDGVLDIAGLFKILQPLLTLIFTTLGAVLKVIGSAEVEVFTLIKGVAALAAQLLHLILTVVGGLAGGLLNTLLGLVGSLLAGTVLPVLGQLGLTDILGSLPISL